MSEKEQVELKEKELKIEKDKAAIERYNTAMQVKTTFMNPDVWTQIRTMGQVFFQSKALPSNIQNEAQLVMVLQSGFEMGMTPIESIHSLYIVNGSINIWGKATTRRIRVHGWKISYKNESDEACTAVVERGDEKYEETYTFKMAEDSGYTKSSQGLKIGWKPGTNRKLKLRYGALSVLIKSYIPDVLGSVGDIQEVAEDQVILSEEKGHEDVVHEKTVIGTSDLAERLEKSRQKKQEQATVKPATKDKKTVAKETIDTAEEAEVVEEPEGEPSDAK